MTTAIVHSAVLLPQMQATCATVQHRASATAKPGQGCELCRLTVAHTLESVSRQHPGPRNMPQTSRRVSNHSPVVTWRSASASRRWRGESAVGGDGELEVS